MVVTNIAEIQGSGLKGLIGTNPYVSNTNSATLLRTGLWFATNNTAAYGMLATGLSAIGTNANLTDTTEGYGQSFATTAAANANAGIRWSTSKFRREWTSYMITRVSFSSTSDIRVFIGFSSDTGADIAGETTLNNLSGVGVGKRAADTNWFTYTNDGDATEDRADTGIAFATTAVTIEIELDSTSFRSRIGSTQNTAVTSELPAATTMLTPFVQIETGAGAADKTINIFPIYTRVGTI